MESTPSATARSAFGGAIGGAIAVGYLFGMTGARILCSLLNGLRALDPEIGLETMCVWWRRLAMTVQRLS